jgi:hypothetical protein
MQHYVMTLGRWLASKAVKAEMKASGRKLEFSQVAEATNVYFMEHREELLREAREHPVAQHYRRADRRVCIHCTVLNFGLYAQRVGSPPAHAATFLWAWRRVLAAPDHSMTSVSSFCVSLSLGSAG